MKAYLGNIFLDYIIFQVFDNIKVKILFLLKKHKILAFAFVSREVPIITILTQTFTSTSL